jgi:hypothetical protein
MMIRVELLPAVAYERPQEPACLPLPDGYDLDRLTIVRALDVRAGDLVVGSADQPVSRRRYLRWATYLHAPYVALPVPVDEGCRTCRAWKAGAFGPSVALRPHLLEDMHALIAVIPAVPGAAAPAVACVHTCPGGGRQQRDGYVAGLCGDCHGRPCAPCQVAGHDVHRACEGCGADAGEPCLPMSTCGQE